MLKTLKDFQLNFQFLHLKKNLCILHEHVFVMEEISQPIFVNVFVPYSILLMKRLFLLKKKIATACMHFKLIMTKRLLRIC